LIQVKEVERVITALESVMRDYDHCLGDRQLAGLKQYCVDLSRLDCFLPGAYRAAAALLDGIQSARLHSRSITEDRMSTAVQLLRDLSAC
jgi:hypothetical protein